MARKSPVYIIESGPAAGAMAAAYMGKTMEIKDIVSFDMGGTTTKTCLIEDNSPKITKEFEVGGRVAGGRVVKGSGWPIRVPVIDLVEIGAGGGSIAWIDSGGALKVGPHSAGADPGPACYGMGGLEPTITDAYVALGVINPEYFIGGELRIDKGLALTAIEDKIGRVFGMDVIETSSAIAEVANSNMARALRLVSIERGRNPKELVMMAFGGAGPMVAGRLMDELEFRSVVVPEAPGLFSAFGLLVSDIGYDYSLTRIRKTKEVDLNILNTEYRELKEKGINELKRENFPDDRIIIRYSADMRYVGQSYELNISIPNEKISKNVLGDLEKRFHISHEKRYGYSAVNESTEIVNLRVSSIGLMPIIKPRVHKKVDENPEVALKTFREVYFRKTKSFVNCPIYDKYRLCTGNRIEGPAIIEQLDSTIVIQPKHVADIDKFNQVVLTHQ
jgi:N-methylhydantoinase A